MYVCVNVCVRVGGGVEAAYILVIAAAEELVVVAITTAVVAAATVTIVVRLMCICTDFKLDFNLYWGLWPICN